MKFDAFDYMAWAKQYQGSARFDLSVSGMPPPPESIFPLDASWLTLKGATSALRDEVKASIAQAYGVAPDGVLLAAGTSEANFLVCAVLLSQGDRVLVEQPAYQALTCLPSVFGARVDRFQRDAASAWSVNLDRIAAAWRPETRLLILSTPHNPTGCVTPPHLLIELGAWLEARDAYALVDEVYRDFMPDAPPVAHALHPRLITTASLTKAYGLSALRAGWAIAPPAIVRQAEKLYDLMGVNPPACTLHGTLSALEARPRLLHRAWERAEAGRGLLHQCLPQAVIPNHGLMALLRLPDGMAAPAFAHRLRTERDTLVVPGDFFDAPGWVRIAVGAELPHVAEGLSHLRHMIAACMGD